jgi:hypothetical protein
MGLAFRASHPEHLHPASGRTPDRSRTTFYDGDTALGTATLSNGIASLTTSSLSADDHDVWVSYAGDDFFASSQSSPILQTVN